MIKIKFFLLHFSSIIGTILALIVIAILCHGCGHNMLVERETIGLDLTIPIGESSHFGVVIGSTKSVIATVRGGTTFTTESAHGAGVFAGAGGVSKICQFKSNIQLNEGNLEKVFNSTNVPDEAKVELSKALALAMQAPELKPSAMQTREAIIYSNGFTNELSAPFLVTGLDRISDNIAHATTSVVHDVTSSVNSITSDTTSMVSDIVEDTTGTINTTMDTITESTRNLTRRAFILLLSTLASIVLVILIRSMFKKKKSTPAKQQHPVVPDLIKDDNAQEAEEAIDIPDYTSPGPKPNKSKLPWYKRLFKAVVAVVWFVKD